MDFTTKNKTYILPGTERKIEITFPVDDYQIQFIKKFGNDLSQYKPSNTTWKEYYLWLENWLDKGTLEQVNKTNRQDLKLLWVKFKNAQLDSNNQLIMSSQRSYGPPIIKISDIIPKSSQAGMLYNTKGANLAATTGDFETLTLLAERNILPDVNGANYAASAGRRNILEWLAERNILPDVNGANYAARAGHRNILEWLAERNILPDTEGANLAAQFRHYDILEWLAERNVIADTLPEDISSDD